MTPFSQKDPRWASKTINKTTSTIGAVGCVDTCLAILCDKQPDQIDDTLTDQGGFVGALVLWGKACQILGLNYSGAGNVASGYPTVAWTDYYAGHGYPTHYFVMIDSSTIIDPIDGQQKRNPYPIRGYQYIHPTNSLTMEERTELTNLRNLLANLKAGKINEYKLPDGTIAQVLQYSHWEDYIAMANDPKNLIEVPQDFYDEIRKLRTGGFQP